MFYLGNVESWLEEIVDTCSKNVLDPSKSIFCLMLFSSLDTSYVDFFKRNKEKISSFSGENVHIFTPIIYNNQTIPDSEWRLLRKSFVEAGANLGFGPSVVLFRLEKREYGSGYNPEYLGAFTLPDKGSSKFLIRLMRDFVSICVAGRSDTTSLLLEVSRILGASNLITRRFSPAQIRLTANESPLHSPTVFLSYSHADSELVLHACDQLKQHGLRVWLDRYEMRAGADVMEDVKRGLNTSDAALLFLSANSATSSWLPFEGAFFHGRNSDRPIIPIVLDKEGKDLASRLPFTSGRIYVDMTDSSKEGGAFQLLAAQIRRMV